MKTLRHLAYRVQPKLFIGFLSLYKQLYRLDLTGIEKRVHDTRYLCEVGTPSENDYITDKKFTIIWASMGKGKSQLIHRVLKDPKVNKSCLYLSARQTFAFSTSGEFTEFTNYIGASMEAISESSHLIMSLESLMKIPEEVCYDLIVCDEIESLFMNFSSETMNKKTYDIFQRFKRLVNDSKKTFFMDAFISNRTLHFVKSCSRLHRGEYQDILFLQNTHIHKWVNAHKIPYDDDLAFQFIFEKIKEGKKMYITFGSNRKMMLMRHHFGLDGNEDSPIHLDKDFSKRVLSYNRNTSVEEMRALENINDTWKEASMVTTTAKLTVGCSYNPPQDSEKPSFDIKVCLGVHSCTARDIFQSLMRVRHVGEEGLYFATGTNMMNFFEKNFFTFDAFNTYEEDKRTFLLNELKTRKEERQKVESVKGKADKCSEIDAMINYLELNKPDPVLRKILYYNSLEICMSSRYYKDYFETLLPLAGFKYEPEKENEEIALDKSKPKEEWTAVSGHLLNDEQILQKYNKIKDIDEGAKVILEKKQKSMTSNNEENAMLEKYFFQQVIDCTESVTSLEIQSKIFYYVWMEGFLKKKLMNEFYYQREYEDLLLKEVNDVKCTEKIMNIAEKIKIVKEIEELIGWEHGDMESIIKPESVRQSYDYLKTNHERIHRVFKLRDRSKKQKEKEAGNEIIVDVIFGEDTRKTQYCLTFINKILKDFNGYSLFSNKELKSENKASEYIFKNSMIYYDYKYLSLKSLDKTYINQYLFTI